MPRWYFSTTPNFFSDWLWPYCDLNLFQNILVALLNADFLARTFDWQTAKIGHVWFVDV
jgi:hypothetical protein